MTSINTKASTQWATRPDDQRFASLIDLNDHVQYVRNNSIERVLPSRGIQAAPIEGDHKSLVVVTRDGDQYVPTHWAFGQLCQAAGAPAGYLRELPSALAADNINYGLHINRPIKDVGSLVYKNGGPAELRALTGPSYGRVWNASITQGLVDRFGDGLTGDFRVPGEFGQRVDVTKKNTTLFASDRDFFVFLADEERRIEVPNRRNGQPGSLARGFYVWNSEVGNGTLGIAHFLFDYVCMNRIVWGVQEYKEIRVRHTASAPDRFIEEVQPALVEFSRSSTNGVVEAIEHARAAKIDKVDEFLKNRFTNSQVAAIKLAHETDEGRPIESVWDATVGITAYARGVQWQDQRVELEREAGKLLKAA